jgi:hypothetical protein
VSRDDERRPRAIIVTKPPIFPGLIAALYRFATRVAYRIPKDTAILRRVATTLGTSASEVQERLSVFNTPGGLC